jgi:hypothetical protein
MTKQAEFAPRDRAITRAARKGLSWADQALAGLKALPKGTRGPGKRFTYLMTCASSPLVEPATANQWSHVFRVALLSGVLERTGRIVKVRETSRTNFKPEYRIPDPDRPITVYVDPATEAEYIRKQLREALDLLPAKANDARAKIADAIERLAPFIDL